MTTPAVPREECFDCMSENIRCLVHDPELVPLHPAIAGVMLSLPAPGGVMNAYHREAFRNALEAAMDLIYPGRQPHRDTSEHP